MDTTTRREFLRGASAAVLAVALEPFAPRYAWADARDSSGVIDGRSRTDLEIARAKLPFGGRDGNAIALNGSVPGPLVRLREGTRATLRVSNALNVDTSIHWHGLLVPPAMDGVPGVSFAGIAPATTFTYEYDVVQSGTYWYHSHSGLQEQSGHYGPLIIDPAEPEPFTYDREYVVLLSDWTFEDPHRVLANLKTMSGYYNYQRRTLVDFARELSVGQWREAIASRLTWGRMRMDPTDIADVTGATYTYLMNGLAPESNWTGLFQPGERVRLRFINGSAMSYFDVRIPGLPLTVVQADGQNVKPVEVDEFRIAVAETYDVIVQPGENRPYSVFAESMDRSGYARGTLAPRRGMEAP
ncbi:MAG TPA: copper resistance system multicopper oxidase, partial [Terrimesophilobacter sp.]|nr:copper resistance system multicopper oxidase [Terrimesophilobacter sp.]